MMPAAIPCYETEADYEAVKAMLPTEEQKLAQPFAALSGLHQKAEQTLLSRGFLPRRVAIKPDALKSWIKSENRKFTHPMILEFAMLQLGSQVLDKGKN